MIEPLCICCGHPAGQAPPLTLGHVCDACLFMSWRTGQPVVPEAPAEPVGLDALRAWGSLRAAWLARAEEER